MTYREYLPAFTSLKYWPYLLPVFQTMLTSDAAVGVPPPDDGDDGQSASGGLVQPEGQLPSDVPQPGEPTPPLPPMVYVTVAMALGVIPDFHAPAFIVFVEDTVIADVYAGDDSVGVAPSVV